MGATAAMMIGQGAMSASGAYAQSQAMKSQGDYQRKMSDINARFSAMQASDAIKRGDKEAAAYEKQAKGLIGSQRAALAAQGIDVNSGSASEVQADTAAQAAEASMAIRNNAWREAWGYRVQASMGAFEGQFAQMAAKQNARSTLLTGGMNAINSGFGAYKALSPSTGGGNMRDGDLSWGKKNTALVGGKSGTVGMLTSRSGHVRG